MIYREIMKVMQQECSENIAGMQQDKIKRMINKKKMIVKWKDKGDWIKLLKEGL